MQYHRHVKKWQTLQGSVAQMAEYGDQWIAKGPFEFCEICGCVPTKLVAPDPLADDDNHASR